MSSLLTLCDLFKVFRILNHLGGVLLALMGMRGNLVGLK